MQLQESLNEGKRGKRIQCPGDTVGERLDCSLPTLKTERGYTSKTHGKSPRTEKARRGVFL